MNIKIIGYVIGLLKEKSTIITLTSIVGATFGFNVTPEFQTEITGLLIAVLTFVGVFTREK